MSSFARVPRPAPLAVRRHGALCRVRWRALPASVGVLCLRPSVHSTCGQLFLVCSTTISIYIWLLAIEATAECSARVPPCALCQRLGVRTITSGVPYACGCTTRVATRCSYVRHDGVTRCKLELPSGPANIPDRPASPLFPVAIITLVSSTFRLRPTRQQAHPR